MSPVDFAFRKAQKKGDGKVRASPSPHQAERARLMIEVDIQPPLVGRKSIRAE